MWRISPAKVTIQAVLMLMSDWGRSRSHRCTRPARRPSRVVATAPLTAAMPPRPTRWMPAVTPTSPPSRGPPRSPASTEPTARALMMAPPWTTGVPR